MSINRCPQTWGTICSGLVPPCGTSLVSLVLLLIPLLPSAVQGMYINRIEYATNQDDTESTTSNDLQETLSWAVKFRMTSDPSVDHRGDYDQIAERIAGELGLLNSGQVGELLNHYLFVHGRYNESLNGGSGKDSGRAGNPKVESGAELPGVIQQDIEEKLRAHPDVEWFHRQRIRRRTKRSLNFKDPSYAFQWHLHNHKTQGMDINVTDIWLHNITGTGVVVAVIDDGLEWKNADILDNYNAKGSWDLNNNDPDPTPEVHKEDGKSLNRHGTRCAGEIAAVANDKCSVGVAFNAQISGIRLLDGPMTDSLEATAFNKNMHINDIYSCSWGPDDDGKTVDGPHPLAQAALKHGVTAGRRGLGSIFVVASGNGGRNEDNCNYDGYANSMYTVTIGAVDENGLMPYYAEQCASMLAVTFSSGSANRRNIVTTDWTLAKGTGCTSSHTGTSAAAPLAAGMIALMLEAKPCLTWRDVQHIIVYTAVKVDEKNAVWITNQGGFHHSHKHGFGLLNAWRLVNAAKAWHTVPWLTSVNADPVTENKPILAGQALAVTQTVSNTSAEQHELVTLEHVLLTLSLTHQKRGLLQIQLVCPSGTKSVIGAGRKKDDSAEGLKTWTFSTVRCWGETPVGEWKLIITDKHPEETDPEKAPKGKLQVWKLTLYGSSMVTEEIDDRKTLIAEAMSGIFLDANLSEPCSYYWNGGYEETNYLSAKAMQILLYISGVFTLMAIYYTLEQAFCNPEDKEKEDEDEEEGGGGGGGRVNEGGPTEETVHLLQEVSVELESFTDNETRQGEAAVFTENTTSFLTQTESLEGFPDGTEHLLQDKTVELQSLNGTKEGIQRNCEGTTNFPEEILNIRVNKEHSLQERLIEVWNFTKTERNRRQDGEISTNISEETPSSMWTETPNTSTVVLPTSERTNSSEMGNDVGYHNSIIRSEELHRSRLTCDHPEDVIPFCRQEHSFVPRMHHLVTRASRKEGEYTAQDVASSVHHHGNGDCEYLAELEKQTDEPLSSPESNTKVQSVSLQSSPSLGSLFDFKSNDMTDDNTAVPVDTLVVPFDTLAVPVDTLAVPVDTLAVSVDTLAVSVSTLTAPAGTLAVPVDTLAVPTDTLAVPVDNLAVSVGTLTAPTGTLAVPVDTLAVPVDTLIAPIDTLAVPVDTLAFPVDTLAIPVDTMAVSVGTLAVSVGSLTVPVDTLAVPNDTSAVPVDTLAVPVGTLAVPVGTLAVPAGTLVVPLDTLAVPIDDTPTPNTSSTRREVRFFTDPAVNTAKTNHELSVDVDEQAQCLPQTPPSLTTLCDSPTQVCDSSINDRSAAVGLQPISRNENTNLYKRGLPCPIKTLCPPSDPRSDPQTNHRAYPSSIHTLAASPYSTHQVPDSSIAASPCPTHEVPCPTYEVPCASPCPIREVPCPSVIHLVSHPVRSGLLPSSAMRANDSDSRISIGASCGHCHSDCDDAVILSRLRVCDTVGGVPASRVPAGSSHGYRQVIQLC